MSSRMMKPRTNRATRTMPTKRRPPMERICMLAKTITRMRRTNRAVEPETSGSPELCRGDDRLRGQDALDGLEAPPKLFNSIRCSVDEEDLEARLIVQVGVGGRADESEELVLPVEEPMGHHAHFMPIDDRDRPDDASTGLPMAVGEGFPDQSAQRLGPAPVTLRRHEPIEIRQEPPLQRHTDALDRHPCASAVGSRFSP